MLCLSLECVQLCELRGGLSLLEKMASSERCVRSELRVGVCLQKPEACVYTLSIRVLDSIEETVSVKTVHNLWCMAV